MTTSEARPATVGDEIPDSPLTRNPLRIGFRIQAAMVLALLLAGIAVAGNGRIVMPDEGVYLAQARVLGQGSWTSDRPATDVDRDGLLAPLSDGGATASEVVHYHKHPLYPLLLTVPFYLGGMLGVLVLSVIGAWAAAVCAGLLARRLGPNLDCWALWVTGIFSPLLFDSYLAVAHTLAAAATAFTFLGVARFLDDCRSSALLYATPSLVLVVALRGEGVLVMGALGSAVCLLSLGLRRGSRTDLRALGTGVAVLALTATTLLLDRVAANALVDGGTPSSPLARLTSESVNAFTGAWASLLRPFAGSWVNADVYVPLAVLGVLLAAVSLRFVPARTALPLVALIGAALASLALWISPPGAVTGLISAFPLLAAGFIWLRRDDMRQPIIRRALLFLAIAGVAITATNYVDGGSTEWGGRFFHLLLPVAVPLAVLGLRNAAANFDKTEMRVAFACLAIVSLSLSGAAMRFHLDRRADVDDLVTATVAFASTPPADDPLVVLTKLNADGSTRFFWDEDIELLNARGVRNLNAILKLAEEAGRTQVVVATDVDPLLFSLTVGPALTEGGWEVVTDSVSPGGTIGLLLLERDSSST